MSSVIVSVVIVEVSVVVMVMFFVGSFVCVRICGLMKRMYDSVRKVIVFVCIFDVIVMLCCVRLNFCLRRDMSG